MKKAYTTLIVLMYILLTITPSLVQSECNQDASLCWQCFDPAASSSATYKKNLQALLSFSNLNLQSGAVGYYNKSEGKEADDQVTVIGFCRGDLEQSPELCKTCLKNISATVLESCPIQKEAIIWGEQCTLRYSNDSRFHLMQEEPLQILRSPHKYSGYVDSETFNAGLKFLLDELIKKASSSVPLYASGSINITESKDIFSLVQCMPSLSQKQCSDCLNESSSKIPRSCCAGVDGARVLKSSCTLRYETGVFYAITPQTFDQQFLITVNPSQPPPPVNPSQPPPQVIWIKIVSGVFCLSALLGVTGVILLIHRIAIIIIIRMRRNRSISESTFDWSEMVEIGSVEPSQFDFDAIRLATEDFSGKNKLGQGGFGPVYKGRYNGQDIAVKRLSKTSQQGDLEFKNEVKLVANLQHRNLVKLLGFCLDKMERLLIYEYVPNSSLDKFIFDINNREKMDWEMRYKIIEGIARGIIYLHVDSNLRIIHRDLKASNILLDENMNPKISDFGMARLFGVDQTQDNTNRIVGTYGYMAPEYALSGHLSIKSDVFSFGVLLLEILSGQKNNSFQNDEEEEDGGNLLTFAWKIWRDGNYSSLIDPIIFRCSRTIEIIRCVRIGLLCVQENPAQRPTMNSVLHMFNSHSEALAEPSKPPLVYESTNFGSAVVQLNNSKTCSIHQEATNDEHSI